MQRLLMCVLCVLAGAVAGCSSTYYRVTDVPTGKVYYSTEVEKLDSGAVTLRDGKSGAYVTLQSSEIEEIPKERFELGRLEAPPK